MSLSGSSPSTPQFDPAAEAQAQIQLEQERARIAEEQRAAEEARRAQEEIEKRAQFDSRLQSERIGARGRIESAITERGLDPNNFGSLISSQLDNVVRGIPDLDPSPQSYFGDSLVDTILDKQLQNRRNEFSQSFDSFAGQGFENNLIGDTADDAILQAILAEQYDPAQQQLQRSFDRGTLNQTGFDAALAGLNNQRTSALSSLDEIGSAVLGTGRDDLRGIAEQGRQGIGSFQLGQSFDPTAFQTRIQDRASEFTGGLEGKIRSAVGGENFFDIPSLINKGGSAQGAVNEPKRNLPLQDALAERETRRQQKRGLGSQGEF